MITQKRWLIFSVSILLILITSCTKEAGEGGTSSIKGKVYATYYNKTFTSVIGQMYAPDKDVYIIYGDDATYSDKQKTCYDGSFEFKYLRKGKYKVYAYSLDTTLTNPATQFAVIAEVTISSNGETIVTDDLIISENQ